MDTPLILLLAGMFFIPFFSVMIPIYIGQRYGINHSKKSENIPHTQVGSVTGAAFGLLAFLLAFTFQIVASRYDARKQLLLEEVTNIRTAYLRAGLIPEPFRTATRIKLVEYVDMREGSMTELSKLNAVIASSQQILDLLWGHAEALAAQDRSSEAYALYTSSVNDIIDVFNQRVTMGLQYRIPMSILIALVIIEFLCMLLLGYQNGISGKGSFRINLLLAIIFSVVMFLIIALDRPEYGISKLSQKPMQTLREQLEGKQLNIRAVTP